MQLTKLLSSHDKNGEENSLPGLLSCCQALVIV